jgi:hypothetical protein
MGSYDVRIFLFCSQPLIPLFDLGVLWLSFYFTPSLLDFIQPTRGGLVRRRGVCWRPDRRKCIYPFFFWYTLLPPAYFYILLLFFFFLLYSFSFYDWFFFFQPEERKRGLFTQNKCKCRLFLLAICHEKRVFHLRFELDPYFCLSLHSNTISLYGRVSWDVPWSLITSIS